MGIYVSREAREELAQVGQTRCSVQSLEETRIGSPTSDRTVKSGSRDSTDRNVQLITAKRLAAMLSVSVRSIWRLKSAGKLPKALSVGGCVRWRRSDIELWLRMNCPDQKTFDARKVAL